MSKLTKKELDYIKEFDLGNCHDAYELAYEPKRLLKEAVLRGYIKPIAFSADSLYSGICIVAYNDDYVFGYHERYQDGGVVIKEDFFKVKLHSHFSSIDGDDSEENNYYYFRARGMKYRLDECIRSCY